jgi:geranyl-CoA carboxylase alpha subunit
LLFWCPEFQPSVRIDSGVEEGGSISPFYDSMIAKIIAHGATRTEAARKLRLALLNTPLLGVATNRIFLARLLEAPEFAGAALSTTSLDAWRETGHALFATAPPAGETIALAAALLAQGAAMPLTLDLDCAGVKISTRYRPGPEGSSIVEFGDTLHQISVTGDFPGIRYKLDGITRKAIAVFKDGSLHLSTGHECFIFNEAAAWKQNDNDGGNGGFVRSPVAGRIAKVSVSDGASVTAGGQIAVIEAMKMEIRVTAPRAGTIRALAAAEGSQIAQGALICEIVEGKGENG